MARSSSFLPPLLRDCHADIVVPAHALAWDSIGAGTFDHLVCLYRDGAGSYVLREVVLMREAPHDVVYETARYLDTEDAQSVYTKLEHIVSPFEDAD